MAPSTDKADIIYTIHYKSLGDLKWQQILILCLGSKKLVSNGLTLQFHHTGQVSA